MISKKMIVDGCEYWVKNHYGEDLVLEFSAVVELLEVLKGQEDVLALLKELDGTINELQNAYDYLQKQFFEVQDKLLKEQEPIKANKIGSGWFCGGCNKFLTTNNDKQINFCWSCGKPVLWEGR